MLSKYEKSENFLRVYLLVQANDNIIANNSLSKEHSFTNLIN